MFGQGARSFDWAFWIQWVLACTAGWFLGGALGAGLATLLQGLPAMGNTVGQLSVGFVMGAMQWLVLRRRLTGAAWWILVTGLGWTLGWLLAATLLSPDLGLFAGLVLGLASGTAQWIVLQRWYHQPGWWIPASAAAWTLGLTGVLGLSLVGTVFGVASGLALELYERYGRLG